MGSFGIIKNGQKQIIPSGSGGGGDGHVIQNASGTDLTQRNILQFKNGLNATDDNINQKTVVELDLSNFYPVGAVYLNTTNTNPATFLGFGTWVLMNEGYLKNGGTSASGGSSTSGSTILSIEQIPAHTHTATTQSVGNHTHTATTQSVGNHTHTATTQSTGAHWHSIVARGDSTSGTGWHVLNVQGRGKWDNNNSWYVDSFALSNTYNDTFGTDTQGTHTHTLTTQNTGAHTHTLTTQNTGNHTHTLTTQSIGGGQGHTHSIEPTYIRVYVFERTA